MRRDRRALLGLPLLLLALPARADEVAHPPGRFALWLPPGWPYTPQGERLTAQNPRGTVTVVAGPLADRDADLGDSDVIDFIDDELDSMTVESDTATRQRGLPARMIAGSGTDEGDSVTFRAVAIDAAQNSPVTVVLVYGPPAAFGSGGAGPAIDHILASLRPL